MTRKRSNFIADYTFVRVTEILPGFLRGAGVTGLILDLDNTLTRWEEDEVPADIAQWVQSLKDAGVALVILSNGLRGKQAKVSRQLGVPLVATVLPKPFALGFREALKVLGVPRENAAVVGDIVFTDIWGANRLGLKTVLVEPLSPIDFTGTKVWRFLEWLFRLRRLPGRGGGE